jgi:hypothetical protein
LQATIASWCVLREKLVSEQPLLLVRKDQSRPGWLAPVSPVVMASKATDKLIKLGWIGAGGINFGSLEGPWNHAVRMQKQNNVQFTAVVDPNVTAAQVMSKSSVIATLSTNVTSNSTEVGL